MTSEEFYEEVSAPKREVLDRIRKELGNPPQQPDEFTIKEAAKELGIEEKTAGNRLKKKEKEGKVTSRLAQNTNGNNARLYKWIT